MAISFNWDQVLAYRTCQHRLVTAATPCKPAQDARPRSVVSQVLGLQSQVPNAALMALWARIPGYTMEGARLAISSGTLTRMWSLRGTVHLHTPEDRGMIAAAVGSHQAELTLRWMHKDGLQPSQAKELASEVCNALRERPMSRQQLAEALASKLAPETLHWITGGWGGVIRLASLYGQVCFDPATLTGAVFTTVPPQDGEVSVEYARAVLLKRYLLSYGPASASDFAFFAGIPVPVANKAAQEASGLISVTVEGKPCLIPEEALDKLAKSGFGLDQPAVSLLPHFDSYMMGHRDRAPVLDPRRHKAVFRQAGWVSPVLLVNGRVAGVWSHKVGTRCVVVNLKPFESLDDQVRDYVGRRVTDLGVFFGLETKLIIHPPEHSSY